jgi:arginase family enzyme
MAQEGALTYLAHGQIPFFRLPLAAGEIPPGTRAVLPGIPTDLGMLRALAGTTLVGMDVVEVAPPLDVGDRTSTLTAHLLFEGLALLRAAT